MKAPCRHHLYSSLLNELCGCCRFVESNPLSQLQFGLFGNFHGTHLANDSIECNSIPPLETLPARKRWSVETLYTLLLRVFIGITFIHFRSFHYTRFPQPKCPQFHLSLLEISSLPHTFTNLTSLLLSPYTPSQPIKSILFTFLRETNSSSVDSSALPNLSGSTDHSLVS